MKRGADNSIIARAELFIQKAKDENKYAIHLAASEGEREALDCLVYQFKFDLFKKDIRGFTAMHFAASNGHKATIDYLHENKLKVDEKSVEGVTVLHCAAESGHCDTINHLVTLYNLEPAKKDYFGRTVLHHAAYGGQIECIKYLITQYPLILTGKDYYGCTVLHHAAYGGQIECIKYLITQPLLSLLEKDNLGGTILHHAAKEGRIECIKFLLTQPSTNRTYLTVMDNSGDSVIHYAAEGGHRSTIELLINKYKLNPGIKNKAGDTALHYAARNGHYLTIKDLVTHGLDPIERNNKGESILDIAHSKKHDKASFELLKFPGLRIGKLGSELFDKPFQRGILLAQILDNHGVSTDILVKILGLTFSHPEFDAIPAIHRDLHIGCLKRGYNALRLSRRDKENENDKTRLNSDEKDKKPSSNMVIA